MPNRRSVAELLRALAAVMAEREFRWYVFGAQAAIIWGSPRLSADVDVTAAIDLEKVGDFIKAMRRRGFELTIDDSDFVARTRVVPFIHRASGMPLDVVLAGRGLEEEFLGRAVLVDVDGALIPVIAPEDLIITKILAARPKDIEDVRSVIHERGGSLDEERIRDILALLEQALGQSDLLPAFEKEWRNYQREGITAKKVKRPGKPKRRPRRR